jgi:hypothetical protein
MNMGRLVWFVTVEVDPVWTAPEDCRHPKAPPSHQRYRPRPSCAANAAPEWQARSVGRSYERCGGLSTPGACYPFLYAVTLLWSAS